MNSYIWIHIGRRFAAALLPPLLGKNPRSHQKGATSRVRTGDQWLPILCHCQLGQDIYLWTHIRIQNLYILFHIHEFINTWIHIFISYMNPYVHEFIWSLNIWIHMYVNSYMLIHMYMNYEHVNSFVYDCFYNSHYHMSCIVSRQWPEVYDLCHTCLHVSRVRKHTDMRECNSRIWLAQRAKTCGKIWYLRPLPIFCQCQICSRGTHPKWAMTS